MKENTKIMLKEYFQQARESCQFITVKWDAGGDECLVYFSTKDSNKIEYFSEDLSWELRDLIVEKLMLPGAGECYNKGEGEVFLNEKNQLCIRFTAKEYYYDYETEQRKLKLEDAYNLKQYLPKANISFSFRAGDETEPSFYLGARIRHGDDIQFKQEEKDYYQKQFQSMIDGYSEEFALTKLIDRQLSSIDLFADLTENGVLDINVDKNYHIQNFYKDTLKILID